VNCYLRFREQFESILDLRTHHIEWLDRQVEDGAMRVWGDEKACLLTSIRKFPTGAFEVHVEIAAGDLETLVGKTIREVEAWAREIGALFVTIASRAGWARVMAPHGYASWQHEIRKELC
jgi:hypothetical protein